MTLEMMHTGLCLALFWTSFCRITRTDSGTLAIVRGALSALAGASLVGAAMPWFWGAQVSWQEVAAICVALVAQLATSGDWRSGVPQYFRQHIDQGEAT